MIINKKLVGILNAFEAITLKKINEVARLMKRQESKYLTTEAGLMSILEELQQHYYLLEIKNFRLFIYNNTYMDSNSLLFYHDHENSKEARIKVRKRKYVDTGGVYIEYKVKTGTKMDKERAELDKSDDINLMDEKSMDFFKKLYGEDLSLLPTMKTNYLRITLCSKTSEERLTIDLNLVFKDARNPENGKLKVEDFVIIEVKQVVGSTNSFCKDVIEKNGGRLAEGCSKYCLGLIYFKKVDKYTHFQKTIDFIESHGGVANVSTGERIEFINT